MDRTSLNRNCCDVIHLRQRNMIYLLTLLALLLFLPPKADGLVVNSSYILQRKVMLQKMNITLHPRPKNSKVNPLYYKQHLTFSHNYTLLINEPSLCSENTHVFLLVMIRTHYRHHERREILREQLKHTTDLPHRRSIIVKHIFMFGKSNNTDFEERTRIESRKHRDIIQEDFPETYVNLIKKVTMAWKWAVNFCPNAEYIMINNDEVLVDFDKLVPFLFKDYSMQQFNDHFAVCFPRGNSRNYQFDYKQFQVMDKKILYKGKFYPPYCHGYGYVAHIYVINQLYKASFKNPPYMPTDVWIGVLSEMLRVKIPDTRYMFIEFNVQQYFANPLYEVSQGMIAVTDQAENKGHALTIMRNVIASMRRHWSKRKIISKLLIEEYHSEAKHCVDCPSWIFGSIYTCLVLFVLFKIVVKCRLLARCLRYPNWVKSI